MLYVAYALLFVAALACINWFSAVYPRRPYRSRWDSESYDVTLSALVAVGAFAASLFVLVWKALGL